MAKCVRCSLSKAFLKVNSLGLCDYCSETLLREKEKTEKELEALKASITPDMQDAQSLAALLERLRADVKHAEDALRDQDLKLHNLYMQTIIAEETIEMEQFGLYRPTYPFTTAAEFKAMLDRVRTGQKDMIKLKTAAVCSIQWTINGSKSEGKKHSDGMIKIALLAFNLECDAAIRDVKFSNTSKCEQRIKKAFEECNKLAAPFAVSISPKYLDYKLLELNVAIEYARRKQEEKEEQAEIRRQQREQAKVDKEIAEARKAAEKERQHFEQALSAIDAQILACTDTSLKAELETKRAEIRNNLGNIEAKLEDIDYRQSNQRAGYVYIISNLGAFGNDVYKIGMTRRLDPMERIDELGDASVPFNFDVHAMIFSADAPALETALHQAFFDRRINKVNNRREYFRVTLDEIKAVVRANHDQTVEFIDVPAAQQYRESIRM